MAPSFRTFGWRRSVAHRLNLAPFCIRGCSPWYLNYIAYGEDWPQYLTADLLDFNGTAAQQALVMGGGE